MSRLEKARAEKKKGRKKSLVIVAAVVLVLLIAALVLYMQQDGFSFTDLFGEEDLELIDLERSVVFIDIFKLSYVRVYINEGKQAATVAANGEELRYNAEHERWELVLSGYEPGDELEITAVSAEDGNITEQAVLTAEEL